MIGPLEVYFSVYLVSSPPFLAQLKRREYFLSDRIKAVQYFKANGEVIKYDLVKRKKRLSNIDGLDNIRAIMITSPDEEFRRILRVPDSISIVWYGRYQWKWTKDCEYLRAYDEASAFYLSAKEVEQLLEILLSSTDADTSGKRSQL